MRIHLAADHAGYELARALEERLASAGHDVIWHGAESYDEGDDFPLFTVRLGQSVVDDEDAGVESKGIVAGATGLAEAITANKVRGVRAVSASSSEAAALGRLRSDANVLAVGSQLSDLDSAFATAQAFINAPFSAAEDDVRRIIHTAEFENTGSIEGWMIEP